MDPADEARTSARRTRFLASPQRRYLTIDGHSPTGGEAFQRAIAELYPVVYALHFMLKARGVSAPIGRLEGLYWLERPAPRGRWAATTRPT